MKIKLSILYLACFAFIQLNAQNDLNAYKYVIVENKFDFLSEENQYRLNELAQFLFQKYGFTALMEGSNYPEDLSKDRCLALRSKVEKDTGMFKTKLQVILKDCNDKVVYTSKIGESREKDYKTAYNLALRDAFDSFQTLNYKYIIKRSKDPEVILNAVKQNDTQAKSAPETSAIKSTNGFNNEKVAESTLKIVKYEPTSKNIANTDILYAQVIPNGYQLVDSTPKVVFKIKQTSLENVFIVEGISALLYKKAGMWVLEYYENENIKAKQLNIKF